MNNAIGSFVSILTLIITVAIIAVIVSKKANTSAVIQSFAAGLSNILTVVVSPVTAG